MYLDLPYAVSRLLFFTVPTDRALTGWQPFQPSRFHADIDADWKDMVNAEARNIAIAMNEDCAR